MTRDATYTAPVETPRRIVPRDPYALLGTPELQTLLGVSRVTLYRWVRDGQFPEPDRRLPGGRKTWLRTTYERWAREGVA